MARSLAVLAFACAALLASAAASRGGVGASCAPDTAEYDCKLGLICESGQCANCISDAQCGDSQRCLPASDARNGLFCQHKPLFPDFDGTDLLGTLLAFLAGAVAAAAGIGGGGLLVPMFILILGFSAHSGIPLSKATIFGGAIANFIVNYPKRHPTADRPLIDYDVALVMEPMTLGGTIIGVLLNKMLPSYLIVFLLVILLGYTTKRTYQKAVATWRKEAEAERLAEAEPSEDSPAPTTSAPNRTVDGTERRGLLSASLEDDDLEDDMFDGTVRDRSRSTSKETLETILEEERHTKVSKIVLLFLLWTGMTLFSLIKGGEGARSIANIECGTVPYWLVIIWTFPFLGGATWYVARYLKRRHELKVSVNYPFHDGDVQWSENNLTKYPLLSIIAGIAAGLLGIGGGMVKGPLLLELGVLPLVQSATAAFMILFTSSSTMVQFLILGMLKLDYALWFAMVGFLSALCGQLALGILLKRYRKTSIIVFALTLVIGLSTVFMGYAGVKQVVEELRVGRTEGFESICA